MKTTIFLRYTFAILIFSVLFSFTSCKASGAQSPATTVPTASQQTTTEPPATTVPQTTVAPTEVTVPPETTAPPETTVPPTTEDDGVFDEKDLLALLDEAGRILAKEDTIAIENPNMYVRQFVRSNSDIFGDYAIWEENKITLICEKVNSDRLHYMKYCVFIHILTTTYEDAVCDWHYNYTLSTGAAKQHVIFFCPSYKEEGFDTPLDCLKASKGKEFAEKNNYFYIDYGYGQCIFEYGLSTLSGIMRYDYMPGDYAK